MKKRKIKGFKKYSEVDKFKYHGKRYFSPASFGISINSKQHDYSTGFYDGVFGTDNTSEFGKSYKFGFARGRKCAVSYYRKTGKKLSNVR